MVDFARRTQAPLDCSRKPQFFVQATAQSACSFAKFDSDRVGSSR